MPRSDMIEASGVVTEVLPNMMFKVKITTGQELLCHLSGKLKTNYIRVLQGDSVNLEISPYDLGKGRIVWRNK